MIQIVTNRGRGMDEEKKEEQKLDEIKSDTDLGLSIDKELSELPDSNGTAFAPKKGNWFKRTWQTKKGKALFIFVFFLLVAGILYAVPVSRYGILGLVIKKEATLAVVDSQTKKPVTQAAVELAGLSAQTD